MIRIDRLEQLAAHLEAGCPGGHEVFDFGQFNEGFIDRFDCGTSGCAAGELPVIFPEDWRFDGNGVYQTEDPCCTDCDLKLWFGVSGDQTSYLFYPTSEEALHNYPPQFGCEKLLYDATRSQVAANIRAFIEWAKANEGVTA